MKLKERPLHFYLEGLFGITLFTAFAMCVVADVPREKEAGLLFKSLLWGTIFGIISVITGIKIFRDLPNGMARPEDELPRGVVLNVHARDENFVGFRGIPGQEDKTTFWEFEELSILVQPGNRIVYLDDPDVYLLKWQKEGVILLLSKVEKPENSTRLRGHLEQTMKDASLGVLK